MLTTAIALILFSIFLFLSVLHIYWGFGGKWASDAVLPVREDNKVVIMPGLIPTFIVAIGLLCFGLLALSTVFMTAVPLPESLEFLRRNGLWIIAGIFLLRAVGEFNYVGFFKKIKHTKFGRNDTRYYAPLCLIIGILCLVLQVSRY